MTSQHYQHTDGNTTLQQLGFKNPGFLKKPSHVGCIEFCWVMVFMQGLCEWRLLKVKHIWLGFWLKDGNKYFKISKKCQVMFYY